jgi:hypothetical protein
VELSAVLDWVGALVSWEVVVDISDDSDDVVVSLVSEVVVASTVGVM